MGLSPCMCLLLVLLSPVLAVLLPVLGPFWVLYKLGAWERIRELITNVHPLTLPDQPVPLSTVGPITNVGGVSEAGPSTSFDHPNTVPILLYHATFQKHVDDIRAGIKLDRAQARTDFCRQKNAFYLTDDKKIAETIMVEEIGCFQSLPTAVMTFSLDLEGLKVKRFSNALAGDTLEDWREHVKYCRSHPMEGPLPHPPSTVTENYDVIIGWMSTKKYGTHEPVDTHVWQYAILTEHALSKLKFVEVK